MSFGFAATAWGGVGMPAVPGDLDLSGATTVADAVTLLKHLDGSASLEATLRRFADESQDGFVTERDVTAIGDLALGLPARPTRLVSSPADLEVDVATTRETILRFRRPLSAPPVAGAITATLGGVPLAVALHVPPGEPMPGSVGVFVPGGLPSAARVRVRVDGDMLTDAFGSHPDVDGDGVAGGTADITFETLSLVAVPGTSVCGTVLASELGDGGTNVPLQGVRISVDGAEGTLFALTDALGNFCLDPCPGGAFFVHVDGRTATNPTSPGAYYPFVGKKWVADPGRMNPVGVIHLPLVAPGTLQPTTAPIRFPQSVIDANPGLPGLADVFVDVPPDSPYFDDGRRGGLVGIGPVSPDRLPGQLPPGLNLPLVITVQTGDADTPGEEGPSNFDTPVPACFPNLPDPTTSLLLAPGEKSALWSFNHDTGLFEIVGPMTVDATGALVCTDPGIGIVAPGWHGAGSGSGGSGNGSPGNGGGGGGGGGRRRNTPAKEPPPPCPAANEEGVLTRRALEGSVSACRQKVDGIASKLFLAAAQPCRGADRLGGLLKKVVKWGCKKLAPDAKETIIAAEKALLACNVWGCNCADQNAAALGSPRETFAVFNEESCVRHRANLARLNAQTQGVSAGELRGLVLQAAVEAGADDLSLEIVDHLTLRLELDEQIEAIIGATDPEALTPAQLAQLEPLLAQFDALFGTRDPEELYELWVEARESEVVDGTADGTIALSDSSLFYILENLDRGFVQRGFTDRAGAFGSLPLIASTNYRIRRLFTDTLQFTEDTFRSSTSGLPTRIPRGTPEDDDGEDLDGDTLGALAELVVGTDPALADSDGDGLRDDAEIIAGSDPLDDAPQLQGIVASVDTPGYARDVCAGPNMIALADSEAGVSVFNVFTGTDPRLVARVDTPGFASRVASSGSLIAVADREAGLAVIDVSNPSAARIARQIVLGSSVVAVAAARGRALVGLENSQVVLVDLATGAEMGRVAVGGSMQDVAFSGGVGLVASSIGLVQISSLALDTMTVIDTATGSGFTGAGGRPMRLFTDGRRAQVTHTNGYATFDVSDPTSLMTLAAPASTLFGWKHVVPDGTGAAFVAADPNSTSDGNHDVFVYDLANPAAIDAPLGTFATPGIAEAVAACGGLGYVADGAFGLQVVRYRGTDTLGVAPTVDLTSNYSPTRVQSGAEVVLTADARDDKAIARVEFFINGNSVAVDCAYPFEHRFLAPATPDTVLTLLARALDTGGNPASDTLEVTTVADATPAKVISTRPVPGGPVGTIMVAWSATFSEPVTLASAQAAFSVVFLGADMALGGGDDVPVMGATTLSPDGLVATFEAPGPLSDGAHLATIGTAIMDVAGNSPFRAFSWTSVAGAGTDSDGDTLTDDFEIGNGTDPRRADTDGDGLRDDLEDDDLDGIGTADELEIGTDPNDADTDDDGTNDLRELQTACRPLVPDLTTVEGFVTRAGGTPVPGALVILTLGDATTRNTMTGPLGTFSLAGVPACGQIAIRATATITTLLYASATAIVPAVVDGVTMSGELVVVRLDTDDDGLPDDVEISLGLLVDDTDSDNDGTSDALEDADADGLGNLLEVATVGTDPGDPDTDGDGFNDGNERSQGCDPLGPDLTTVVGRVVIADPGLVPVGGASVTAGGAAPVLTLADGTFSIPNVRICTPLVTASAQATYAGTPASGLSIGTTRVVGGTTNVGDIVIERVVLAGIFPCARTPLPNPDFFDRPASGISADVNADGLLDLLIPMVAGFSDANDDTLVALLGRGDSTFDPPLTTQLFGEDPTRPAIGNLNGDAGSPEVVIGVQSGAGAVVLKLTGNGSYTSPPPSDASALGTVAWVLLGEFNATAGPDVVACAESGACLFFANNGGFLASGQMFDLGSQVMHVEAADVDGDGDTDLVAMRSGTFSPTNDGVWTLPCNGNGTFGARLPLQTGTFNARQFAIGNFGGGAAPDVVTAGGETVSLFLGDDANPGEFLPRIDTSLPQAEFTDARAVRAFDVDGDGTDDAVVTDTGARRIVTFRGSGGALVQALAAGATRDITAACLGRFDDDARPDAVILDGGLSPAAIFLKGIGGGVLESYLSSPISSDALPDRIASGDFDADGDADILALLPEDPALGGPPKFYPAVQEGMGDGLFAGLLGSPSGGMPAGVEVADLNGDNMPDAAWVIPATDSVQIRLGDGTLGILGNVAGLSSADEPLDIAAGELHSLHPGMETAIACRGGNEVTVVRRSGANAFTVLTHLPVTAGPVSVAVGDFNGDGKGDVAAGTKGTGAQVKWFPGNDDGTFGTVTTLFPSGFCDVDDLQAADFDENGKDDIVMGRGDDFCIAFDGLPPVHYVDGIGGFGDGIERALAADVNGDGHLDVVMPDPNYSHVVVYIGDGDGNFASPVSFLVGPGPADAVATDVNGDGRIDLVVGTTGGGTRGLSTLLAR